MARMSESARVCGRENYNTNTLCMKIKKREREGDFFLAKANAYNVSSVICSL